MQQWEYLIITSGRNGNYYANGQLLPSQRPSLEDIFRYLNQYGDQGWELVGVTVSPANLIHVDDWGRAKNSWTQVIYCLKRPKHAPDGGSK